MQLKDQMGVENILAREQEINTRIFDRLSWIEKLHVFAGEHQDRLGIFSFSIEGIHYNLVAKFLNDRFGIQSRGGCSCAGTYGHYLFKLSRVVSDVIHEMIQAGCLTDKPGWVRISVHPTMKDSEIDYICDALEQIVQNYSIWEKDYIYDQITNDFEFIGEQHDLEKSVKSWFRL